MLSIGASPICGRNRHRQLAVRLPDPHGALAVVVDLDRQDFPFPTGEADGQALSRWGGNWRACMTRARAASQPYFKRGIEPFSPSRHALHDSLRDLAGG
jgi:hypothetical protein